MMQIRSHEYRRVMAISESVSKLSRTESLYLIVRGSFMISIVQIALDLFSVNTKPSIVTRYDVMKDW